MEAKFSQRVKEVIQYSREEAIRLGHDYIGCEHLLLGIIREGEGKAIQTIKMLDIDALRLKKSIEDAIRTTATKAANLGNIPLTKQAEKALKITYLEAKIFKTDLIGTEHLLLSILRDEDNVASKILNQYGVNYDVFKSAFGIHTMIMALIITNSVAHVKIIINLITKIGTIDGPDTMIYLV